MPYTTKPRPYKHEYDMEKKRGEHDRRMERQRARRTLDKKVKTLMATVKPMLERVKM